MEIETPVGLAPCRRFCVCPAALTRNRVDPDLSLQLADSSRISASMPLYFFSLKTRNAIPHAERQGEFPDLRAALADAHAAARSMLHTRRRHAPLDVHGSLDVEDERRRPVARIMLADVARQIS